MLKEALLYEKLEENRVSCHLCSHRCRIGAGRFGVCSVRENRGGTLYTHVYGGLIAQNVDPIEKKPLYHFLPGSTSYSIATVGCNFKCDFCQNWQISQVAEVERLGMRARQVKPEDVVRQAKATGSASISYTYTEPTIYFEFAYDCAKAAKQEGLYNVFVTNGYMTREMLEMIRPCLDAANVDLKAYSDDFYKRLCKARLQPVLENIRTMKEMGIWIEVTTLVVPGQNDSETELKGIAAYLASVDVSIPWHISRFHPQYRMDHLEPTPMKILNRAYEIGREAGLRYVYLGNVAGKHNHTYCYHCGNLLIERAGFSVSKHQTEGDRCPKCGTVQDGVRL
ncbi:MAG TPA: AmmeMemoRadiSam system radical SAM enzyme [Syntrophales bacterium]|nr:AmmeMemoRadiSam system radical SAM enzyme [Syntrophales bacterium]HOX94281.1 AmmeMemoRadiSam system radical SAM enzyme [Syntrophales bacterium]HPI56215.1 AmmeMemoRadiSam system radical SAM enzyme [Syntrophales bacterium]HPN24403.1 AmmeMemoRadiSam system radical SAM enzyme [Syntrophales bacterium]HQM29033.1 AmmeMemoRadiSam system radical SAM enzyme [Syntrophales bacterium]